MDIVRTRLRNQRLAAAAPATGPEVVRWLGAVQAQDYAAAKWAVGQRAGALTSATLDDELAAGTILRTHVLRPTWHLVTPADIRWMLELTAPRIRSLMAYGNRQSGLNHATFARAEGVILEALVGGRQLTRSELGAVLLRAGIETAGSAGLGRVMLHAELDGLVCSGALCGKQHTYALLDERTPPGRASDRDRAMAELAARYFASHGPATISDFSWWSGLSAADARRGANTAEPALEPVGVENRTYWFSPRPEPARRGTVSTMLLLPNFDEYTVAYADRGLLHEHQSRPLTPVEVLGNTVIVEGRVVGAWKRVVSRAAVRVTLSLFRSLSTRELAAARDAAERYGRFCELPVTLELHSAPAGTGRVVSA